MTNKIKVELKWYPKRLCQFKLKYASVLPEASPPKAFDWEGRYVSVE